MMRVGFVILFFILNFNRVIGQNLVNNPSFEEHGTLVMPAPNESYAINTMANNWIPATNWKARYAHIDCDTIYQWNYNPYYLINGRVMPRTGKACAAFTIDDTVNFVFSPDYRQYCQNELVNPIVINKYYKVGFYVILAKNCKYAGNGMGILFTNSQLQVNSLNSLFNYNPQIYFNICFTNTEFWEKKEVYFKSDFNATHLTIGHFAPQGQQQYQINSTNVPISPQINQPVPWLRTILNYIDDVYVIPIAPVLEADSAICKGASATLTVRGEVEWKWAEASNPFQIIGTDSILTVTPTETTTYIYYGFSDTLQHTVYVRNPPLFKMGVDTFLCKGNTLVLTPELEGQRYWWSTGDTTQSISVTATGAYKVTIQHGPCFVSDDVFVGFSETPDWSKFNDTTICPGDHHYYYVSNPFSVFTWHDGSHQAEYDAYQDETIKINIQNACGNFDHAFNVKLKDCPCNVFMPSAFSPNADQVNDEFQFATECRLEHFHFEIYDRWGKKVFEGADENAVWTPSANTPEGLYAVKYYYKGKDNANIVEFTKYQSILIIK